MRDLDIRCSARLPDPDADFARCQLAAGHEGEHAVMYCSRGERLVCCWDHRLPGVSSERTVHDAQRPWLRGFPVPAWVDESSDGPSTLVPG